MKALLLAGGSGSRLWPLSRSLFPKQFIPLIDEESFFQKSVKRFLAYENCDAVYVLTHADFQHEVKAQLVALNLQESPKILLEPSRRNTAPAVALALQELISCGELTEEDVVFIGASDHLISPLSPFFEALNAASLRARQGDIMTFGVSPMRPEIGYGYIHYEDGEVRGFVEKPSFEKAQEYLLNGNYFWNSGMFLFSVGTFKEELEKYAPEIAKIFQDNEAFHACPELSLDYAVMERTEKMGMIPLNLTWSDVGSWEDLYLLQEKDENRNVLKGEVVARDTKESLIHSSGRLIATIGLEKMLVVETEDALLIAPRNRSQEIKQLVSTLKEQGKQHIHEHCLVKRPWGSYHVLEEGHRYKMKRIEVLPKAKLSLQMHYHRSEHWVVVSGTALVTIDEKQHVVHEGESIFVPKSSVHRIENPGKVTLEIIEVQVGEYLGEDDILRFEDIYGRKDEAELLAQSDAH
jgi:mannose-1-phosphate guanylyltransferase / mannose-6-phosphate isomerase